MDAEGRFQRLQSEIAHQLSGPFEGETDTLKTRQNRLGTITPSAHFNSEKMTSPTAFLDEITQRLVFGGLPLVLVVKIFIAWRGEFYYYNNLQRVTVNNYIGSISFGGFSNMYGKN